MALMFPGVVSRQLLAKWTMCAAILAAIMPAARAQGVDKPRTNNAPKLVSLHIRPAEVTLTGPRSMQQLLVDGKYSDGLIRDVTAQANYTVANEKLIDVWPGGFLLPLTDGETTVQIQLDDVQTTIPAVVRGMGNVEQLSFRNDVIGVLNVGGCNSGACHGTPSGKNGFKLSLRGFDPDADFRELTRDVLGRRTSRNGPENSLIYLKALGRVPHEGGQRFQQDSIPARMLYTWLCQGLQNDSPGTPTVERVDVVPGDRLLNYPNKQQQLAVIAHFSNGESRDVTRLTVFSSSDANVANVSANGLVEFASIGEVAILCRYLDHLVTVRLTYVEPREGFSWPNPPEHNYVDKHVFAKLKMMNIPPSGLCTDEEFIRRVYLDLCGVLPTAAEVREFLADQRADKRARLIDHLLERPEYADFWTLKWSDVFRSSRKNIELQGAFAFQKWLRSEIAKNTPMDEIVRQLLTATGSTFSNPPANYFRVAKDPTTLAETTAQLFFGIRMQCAKCHNHPFERWTQDDYYSLAAFFARVKRRPDFTQPPEKNKPGAEFIYLARSGDVTQPRTGKPALPRFLGGKKALEEDNDDRREILARWITSPDNPFFARSVANRVWYHLLGRGIVDPVDDFRDSNPSANDALLDALAEDFVKNEFDLKHLMRTIANSRTYQLSAQTNKFNETDAKYFSHAVTKLYSAEQLFDAICTVTEVPENFPNMPPGTRATQLPDAEFGNTFLKTFGQPARELACECERENESNLAQALQLINGPTVNNRLRKADNRIGKLLAKKISEKEMLVELYLSTLSRRPLEHEVTAVLEYMREAKEKRRAWEDVLWALINSKEFLFRH